MMVSQGASMVLVSWNCAMGLLRMGPKGVSILYQFFIKVMLSVGVQMPIVGLIDDINATAS